MGYQQGPPGDWLWATTGYLLPAVNETVAIGTGLLRTTGNVTDTDRFVIFVEFIYFESPISY